MSTDTQPAQRASWLTCISSGMVAGVIVLGLVGRYMLAGLALLLSYPINLTGAGLVLAGGIGAVLGAAGGAVLRGVFHGRATPGRGLMSAGLVYVAGLVLLLFTQGMTSSPGILLSSGFSDGPVHLIVARLATLVTVGLIHAGYGIALVDLVRRRRA